MSGHKGLYGKYRIIRADTNEQLSDGFVLRPGTDTAARIALATYAEATHNPRLSLDIKRWLNQLKSKDALKELDIVNDEEDQLGAIKDAKGT